MTIPIIIGWPQIILFIIGLIGLGLLITSVMSLYGSLTYKRERRERLEREREHERRERRERQLEHHENLEGEHKHHVAYEEAEEAEERHEEPKFRPRRRFISYRRFYWRRGVGGVVVMVFALLQLWLTFLIQAYLGLTSDIRVAQIRATAIQNTPDGLPQMDVEIVLYNQDGNAAAHGNYILKGDRWQLTGDIIKFPPWVGIFGLHSGYKVTRLEGFYSDPNLESNAKHTVVELNGGEDGFFTTMHNGGQWYSFLVQAYYGNEVFQPPDGNVYNIYVSNTGLYPLPAS